MQFEISLALNFLMAYLYNKLPRRRVNMLGEQMSKYLNIKFQDHWYPNNPTQGSAYRAIRITKDKIDKVLINATIDVGLDLQEILDALPKYLTIWIDPGEVSYCTEEKGPITILYTDEHHPIRYNELSSDNDELLSYESNTSSLQTHHVQMPHLTDRFSIPSPVASLDLSSWPTSMSTPVLSIQTFAQTRFGSLKTKESGLKKPIKISSNEFSSYIKHKQQTKTL